MTPTPQPTILKLGMDLRVHSDLNPKTCSGSSTTISKSSLTAGKAMAPESVQMVFWSIQWRALMQARRRTLQSPT